MASKNKAKPERKLRLLKLVSGNTVLANVLYQGGQTDQEYELTKPMEVVIMPDPKTGQTMVTLMDFLPACADEVVRVGKQHVITTGAADGKVEALYRQVTEPQAIAQPPEKALVLPPGA